MGGNPQRHNSVVISRGKAKEKGEGKVAEGKW